VLASTPRLQSVAFRGVLNNQWKSCVSECVPARRVDNTSYSNSFRGLNVLGDSTLNRGASEIQNSNQRLFS
jgi:hypothetical protein